MEGNQIFHTFTSVAELFYMLVDPLSSMDFFLGLALLNCIDSLFSWSLNLINSKAAGYIVGNVHRPMVIPD